MRRVGRAEPFNGAPPLPEPPPHASRVRYAPDRAFPSYRYVPGSGQPHPVNDPRGSLYSAHGAPVVPRWKPEDWRHLGDWLHGVDLFNHWYFWEAHEAWEGLWQVTDKQAPPGLLLQGLIQLSAALLKVHLRSLPGAKALWEGSGERLEGVAQVAPGLMGVDAAAVRKMYAAYFAPLRDGVVPPLGPQVPVLELAR